MLTLIIEPNVRLFRPFSFLGIADGRMRVQSIEDALKALRHINPDLVMVSASFSPHKSLQLLEALRLLNQKHLVPLIYIVDFSHRINFIPGVSWAGRIAVVDCWVSKSEFDSTISRVLHTAVTLEDAE